MKFVLLGLYCGPLLTLIPPLTRTKAKNRGSGNRVIDFRVSGGPPVYWRIYSRGVFLPILQCVLSFLIHGFEMNLIQIHISIVTTTSIMDRQLLHQKVCQSQ